MATPEKVVAKFGGSSVKDAEAIKRSAKIVAQDPSVRVVVISATQSTTNHLEELLQSAVSRGASGAKEVFQRIWERHKEIAKDLDLSDVVWPYLNLLQKEIWEILEVVISQQQYSDQQLDHIYSFGERISSFIFSRHLKNLLGEDRVDLIESKLLIKTTADFRRGLPLTEKIANACQKHLQQNKVYVTQGFLGESPNGDWVTLGREGSDYSAALIGEGFKASAVYIWTDVPGVATTDPRAVANAKMIPMMSYQEATSLARLGAKVLFSETLLPAERSGIPVFVGSSLRPDLGGTWIEKISKNDWPLVGIATMNEMTCYRCTFQEGEKDIAHFLGQFSPLFPTQIDQLTWQFYLPRRRPLTQQQWALLGQKAKLFPLANQTVLSFVGKIAGTKDFENNLKKQLTKLQQNLIDFQILGRGADSISFSWPTIDANELLLCCHDYLLMVNQEYSVGASNS